MLAVCAAAAAAVAAFAGTPLRPPRAEPVMLDVAKTAKLFQENGLGMFGPRRGAITEGGPPREKNTGARSRSFAQKGQAVASRPLFGRGRALPAEVSALTARFKKEYEPAQLSALWSALVEAYGSEELAARACESNPQIINPSYTDPPALVLTSKRALLEMMDEEEALDVMAKNPSVLQCGTSLTAAGADGIKSFANARSAGNALLPTSARAPLLVAVLAAVAARVSGATRPRGEYGAYASRSGDAIPHVPWWEKLSAGQ